MLTRPLRLRHRLDISRVYKRGRQVKNYAISLHYLPNYTDQKRAVVVVSTKVAKRAVERNRLRRRLYGSVRNLWPLAKNGYDLIITAHAGAAKLSAEQLQQRLEQALDKGRLLET